MSFLHSQIKNTRFNHRRSEEIAVITASCFDISDGTPLEFTL